MAGRCPRCAAALYPPVRPPHGVSSDVRCPRCGVRVPYPDPPAASSDASVLFSLSALTERALQQDGPAPGSAGGEDSGLIDLGALKSAPRPPTPAHGSAPAVTLGLAGVDAPLGGAPPVAPPPPAAPTPARRRDSALIGSSLLVAGAILAGAWFVAPRPGPMAVESQASPPGLAAPASAAASPVPSGREVAPQVQEATKIDALPEVAAPAEPEAAEQPPEPAPPPKPRVTKPVSRRSAPKAFAKAPAKAQPKPAPEPVVEQKKPPKPAPRKDDCTCPAGDLLCAMSCATRD